MKNYFIQRLVAATMAMGLMVGGSASAATKTFAFDVAHTAVGFKIRHLLTQLPGKFAKFDGEFQVDEKTGELVGAKAHLDPASIETGNTKRDSHLKSDDFFDVAKFPTITFESESVKIKPGSSGKLPGKLTLHGVTKKVEWAVDYMGEAKGMNNDVKAGATATLKINRKDFGLEWNQTLETGGVLVGDDVTIEVNVEGNLQAPAVKTEKKDSPKAEKKDAAQGEKTKK